jgi:RNA polymerase sigma factor (sigma-70 family)
MLFVFTIVTRRNFSRRHRPNARCRVSRRTREAAYKMKTAGDDSEHMARLAAGDVSALRELYQRHGRSLLRFSAAMCRSRQAAEDLVHDTFVALLREPNLFDPALGSVYGYLCGVLRHRVSRHFRHERRLVALEDETGSQQQVSSAECPVDEIARSEMTRAFRRAFLELPLQHREVIALCDLEELPYATVANVLNCPVGTVRSRLHRARALLTLRLASLELVELADDPAVAQEGLS